VPKVFVRQVFADEYVPKMAATLSAGDFSAFAVIIKTWPTAIGFKFVLRIVQWSLTLPADVHSFFFAVHVFTRKRRFRAFINDDPFFFFCQYIHVFGYIFSLSQEATRTLILF